MADSILRSEQVALYAIILGFLGIAIAYITFGIAQLKLFEAWMPYIFIFIGAIYLGLSLAFLNSMRKATLPEKQGKVGPSKVEKLGSGVGDVVSGISNGIKALLPYLQKYKLPIFVLLAFVTGVFITYMVTSGSGFQFNFALPSIQLPAIGIQNQTQIAAATGTTSIKNIVPDKSPVGIIALSSSKTGENYTFSFSLVDKSSEKVNASGNVSLKVLDQSNKLLYEENFEVRETDFSSGIYSKLVDATKVNKSVSGNGTANITFLPSTGSELSSSTNVEVPVYSTTELQGVNENEYQSSARVVGKSVSKFLFDVTVVKMGFFDRLEAGTTTTYFRVDLKVKNTGAVEEEFRTSAAKLTLPGSSYILVPESPFKNLKIKGGQIKEDYILFKDVPSTISGTIQIRAGTANPTEANIFEYIVEA